MVREFCDRCFRPVGNIGDGGKSIKKHQTENVLAYIGQKQDFVACPICYDELYNAITKWLTKRD